MSIEEGSYYVNEYTYVNGIYEKNIMKVIGKSKNVDCYKTESLWITGGEVGDLYLNEWYSEFLQREATTEEIEVFKTERSNYEGPLKGYAEAVTGVKIGPNRRK